MKILLILCFFVLFSCNARVKNDKPATADTSTVNNTNSNIDKSAYYTTTDSVIIASKYFDTIGYSKREFNEIIDQYDYLIQEFPDPPNIAWAKDLAVALKTVKDNDPGFLDFSSEAGQDNYYQLYAHFLMQRDSSPALIQARDKLNKIYQDINDMSGELARGGTYYGHQYNRIAGFAEYAISTYAFDSSSFIKISDIGKQKALFILSLKQSTADEIATDNDFTNADEKEKFREQIFAYINDLDKQITDGFYLYYARQFYYNNY